MRLYIIRHGQTDWNGNSRVMGEEPIPLNDDGRSAVSELARFLAADRIPVIFTSTVLRARQSADILAEAWGATVREEPRLNESPYERWVGRTYAELATDPEFQRYTTAPSRSRFSEREGMADIQRRALAAVRRIVDGASASDGGYERAAAVSHSDVIKPVIAHYLGMELDSMHRLAIANASVTMIDFGRAGAVTGGEAEHSASAPVSVAPRAPRIRYLNVMPWKWRAGAGT